MSGLTALCFLEGGELMAEFISGYIKTELLVLVPILWLCGKALKRSTIKNYLIPIILGMGGVALALVYVFSVCECFSPQAVLSCIFAGVTQGLLCAGASVYVNELIKSMKNK